MGQEYSVMEYIGGTAIAIAVAIANQGSLARLLEMMGWNVEDPSQVRAREDMHLVMSVVMGFSVLFAVLTYIQRVRDDSYEAGVNADRVTNDALGSTGMRTMGRRVASVIHCT